jgi:hypothetical protein
MKSRFLIALLATTRALLIAALAALPFSLPIQTAHAAATTQTTHAWLCAPEPSVGAPGPRRVVNTSSTATTQPSYSLNGDGCALIAGADIGFFLSQGFYYGPALFSAQATALSGGASGTTAVATNFTLPAYGWITGIVVCETAGNAVTGGLDIGDAGSITKYASAVTLGANACTVVTLVANSGVNAPSGVPTADPIQIAAHAAGSWNSASVNITILYTYF